MPSRCASLRILIAVSPDNVAQMSPCCLAERDRLYLFTNTRPRVNRKIALAVANVPGRK